MNILLAVSGSIAAYKSYDLLRSLIKSGHHVKVVLSQGALKFIRSETFKYLGALDVYESHDDFVPEKLSEQNTVLHIELARWCDRFVLYPASANMISKFSFGQTTDLCSSIFLSLNKDKEKIIFPAMNKEMYFNEITQNNLKLLEKYIVPPDSGSLACGEEGVGKLPLPEVASDLIETWTNQKSQKSILISTGATLSPLDSVRYLTNPSSGKTGYYLAKEFLAAGHKVDLLYSSSSTSLIQNLKKHPNLKLHQVTTTLELESQTLKLFQDADLFISSAAPSDILFEQRKEKIKKKELNKHLSISLAPDILEKCIKVKKPDQVIIGFAAETEINNKLISEKLSRKPVDLLIANIVNSGINGEIRGFQNEMNEYHFITQDESKTHQLSKKSLSSKVRNWFEQ